MKRLAILVAAALVATAPTAPPLLAREAAASTDYSVGAQHDTTHVYVPHGEGYRNEDRLLWEPQIRV